MVSDSEYYTVCYKKDMPDMRKIGSIASERTMARFNEVSISTAKMKIIFEAKAGRSLISEFAKAINGMSIANGTSFLKDKMGEQIFGKSINIYDDAEMKFGIGSRPFDAEGIYGSKLNIVENGVLNHWLLDINTASQLNLKTNGRASVDSGMSIRPSHTNLYLSKSNITVDDLLNKVGNGLYVIETFGFGVNLITGNYSQGASGFLIEDGVVTDKFVQQITIAGNLAEMFMEMEQADNLSFRTYINTPDLYVGEMTVGA